MKLEPECPACHVALTDRGYGVCGDEDPECDCDWRYACPRCEVEYVLACGAHGRQPWATMTTIQVRDDETIVTADDV